MIDDFCKIEEEFQKSVIDGKISNFYNRKKFVTFAIEICYVL